MRFLKFEYKATLLYLLIGGLWILFSDQLLSSMIHDSTKLSEIQTYKGWFYVFTTAMLFFWFLKKQSIQYQNNERALKESELRYREVFENINDCLFLLEVSSDGRFLIVEFNPAEEKSIGLKSKDIMGKTLEDLFPAEIAKALNGNYRRCIDAGKLTSYKEELSLPIGDRVYHTTLVPIFNIEGQIHRILGIGHDITEKTKSDLELEMYRSHLEQLVQEKTNDLENINEELTSINQELYDKNEIINTQNSELKTAILHLQTTQAQLIQSEKMASLGVLTAGVAHEINNPLNYILGAYYGLSQHYENKSFSENYLQIGELINALKIGVERSTAIVQGLNQFSKNSKSLTENCEIHTIIENCLSILQHQIKHRIVIEKDFYSEKLNIKGNTGGLHQIFINILGNAIHAIEKDGTISIKTRMAQGASIIEIKDSGAGISPENLEKITEPFFTTKEPGKGTGLGLAITYNIIKEHKGSLEFKSQLGHGTTARISLPQNC